MKSLNFREKKESHYFKFREKNEEFLNFFHDLENRS